MDVSLYSTKARARSARRFLVRQKDALTLRDDFDSIARFAAKHTYYSADEFILRYVAAAATRLADDHHGVPMFFHDAGDIGDACYTYSLRMLAQMAREAVEDDMYDTSMYGEFMDALGEAMVLGMLWD